MTYTDILTSVCLLSLGGIILGAGLWRLDRMDRRRAEIARQSHCCWHHWQAADGGGALVCGLCGKRAGKLNPWSDRRRESVPSDQIFP